MNKQKTWVLPPITHSHCLKYIKHTPPPLLSSYRRKKWRLKGAFDLFQPQSPSLSFFFFFFFSWTEHTSCWVWSTWLRFEGSWALCTCHSIPSGSFLCPGVTGFGTHRAFLLLPHASAFSFGLMISAPHILSHGGPRHLHGGRRSEQIDSMPCLEQTHH